MKHIRIRLVAPSLIIFGSPTGGIVTITPSGDLNAETYLNGQRIRDTTILQHGAILKLGSQQPQPGSGDPGVRGGLQGHTFRFADPAAAAYPLAMQNPQPQTHRVSVTLILHTTYAMVIIL